MCHPDFPFTRFLVAAIEVIIAGLIYDKLVELWVKVLIILRFVPLLKYSDFNSIFTQIIRWRIKSVNLNESCLVFLLVSVLKSYAK